MLIKAQNFLENTKAFLASWVYKGYDTCHRTYEYDAEPCHKDCKKLEKGDFAKECEKDNGLFKCCIR